MSYTKLYFINKICSKSLKWFLAALNNFYVFILPLKGDTKNGSCSSPVKYQIVPGSLKVDIILLLTDYNNIKTLVKLDELEMKFFYKIILVYSLLGNIIVIKYKYVYYIPDTKTGCR